MGEFFKNLSEQIKKLWGKWSLVQKVVFFAITGGAIIAIIMLFAFSSAPSMTRIFRVPITDEITQSNIVMSLDGEGIKTKISDDGYIMVDNEAMAYKARAILEREELIPDNVQPWDFLNIDRWTQTDFERKEQTRLAIERSLEQHIKALEDIDSVRVMIVLPEDELFEADRNPVTASVRLTGAPGSQLGADIKKIQGIERMIKTAVEGLQAENIIITDHRGIQLNDFANLAEFDRVELANKEIQTKTKLESSYREKIRQSLQAIFKADRVEILKVEIDLDMSKEIIDSEKIIPTVLKEDNPNTPYDDSEITEKVAISETYKDIEFRGSGYNPEGPPGAEGQTAPEYKDLSDLTGEYTDHSKTINWATSNETRHIEKSPWEIRKITVGVAIDGSWTKLYDSEKGEFMEDNQTGGIKRVYEAVDPAELERVKSLIQAAIGFQKEKGDLVMVEHLQFDRSAQFEEEDSRFRQEKQLKLAVFYAIIGLVVVIIAFIAFRLISRELERRRRLREEELARQHAAMREAALRSAEDDGVDVEMSVEERARMEMQENAVNMAREHPEDVAQLIRTWLLEE